MGRLHVATRGIGNWQSRLAEPERHWKREYSAMETAVSWEAAARRASGLPVAIEDLFSASSYSNPQLLLAVAEHKVELAGRGHASQADVWVILRTSEGLMSMAVEAKVDEAFGGDRLDRWLVGNASPNSARNRQERWEYIQSHLPASTGYGSVPYQLLHRCAAAVIEAKRFGFGHAALIIQTFGKDEVDKAANVNFQGYATFCNAMGIDASTGTLSKGLDVNGIRLSVGWAECRYATDAEIAAIA